MQVKSLVLILGLWVGMSETVLFGQASSPPDSKTGPPIEVVMSWYWPDRTWVPTTQCVNRFLQENPSIAVRPFSNLKLPAATGLGSGGEDSTMLMAFAGGTAPDVVQCWFHKIEPYQQQGFILSLAEFIGEDRDGDGYISDAEARWDGWKRLSPAVRRAATINGKPYGLPIGEALVTMTYRRDLVREVTGSEEPPRSWEDFFHVCQKLTKPAVRQVDGTLRKSFAGFYADSAAFRWLPWLWSAGGEEVMQGRKSPTDGKVYWFPKEVIAPKSPAGEDLSRVKPTWRATFASEAGIAAMGIYWKLLWQPWICDPKTGEPINLTEEEARNHRVRTGDGRTIDFTEAGLFRGVSRGMIGDDKEGAPALFSRGEICFYIGEGARNLPSGLAPSQIGIMGMPSPDGKQVAVLRQPASWFCLNSALASAPREKREAAWKLLKAITGENYERTDLNIQKESGSLRFADPELLRKYRMDEYIADIPEHWQKELKEISQHTHTEPFIGHWQAISDLYLGRQILSRLISDQNFDYKTAIKMAEDQANYKVMRGRSNEEFTRIRPWARLIFAVIVGLLFWACIHLGRGMRAVYLKPEVGIGFNHRLRKETLFYQWLPWLFIGPALTLVLMWTYYPLARGLIMAFQDYRVLGEKPFVGLDNFITVFLDPKFYKFLWITCKYVMVNLLLGFVSPIVLAIMLNEIPMGKLGLRMVFLLPQVCSGLVIAFIWQMMYYPTEMGFFNSLLLKMELITKPVQFLFDPNLALFWVTIPAVWAGLGGGSLLYLAALKTVSDDLYEAAEIDGAGIWTKLVKITIPTLLPIILINFLGSFIGLFHSMGNIFLLTGGGPGDDTTVISLAIWRDAFLLLKFGTATATAWILAAMLMGCTILQLRVLSRVEWRRAQE